jgi:hypothetical protein
MEIHRMLHIVPKEINLLIIIQIISILTYSLNIIISIERCADMAVNRAKTPLPVSIWKTNIYIIHESKTPMMTTTRRKTALEFFFICIRRIE